MTHYLFFFRKKKEKEKEFDVKSLHKTLRHKLYEFSYLYVGQYHFFIYNEISNSNLLYKQIE